MAKVYFNRYMIRIESGEITVEEAIDLARTEVPARWRDAVIEMLEAMD